MRKAHADMDRAETAWVKAKSALAKANIDLVNAGRRSREEDIPEVTK
jgi:hypothetical protein